MPAAYRIIVDASIGLLFIKGLLLVPVTLHAFAQAYLAGRPAPAVGVASCAAGSFAFGMACVGVWIRKHLDLAEWDAREPWRARRPGGQDH